jgi:hypothetical protein
MFLLNTQTLANMKAHEVLKRYADGRRDFSGENLRGQSFKGKDLSGANFSKADIRGANFTNAKLIGANFSGAKAGLQRRWVIGLVITSWVFSALSGLFLESVSYYIQLIFRFVSSSSKKNTVVPLAQLQAAINDPNLADDDKAQALEQIKVLAEAGQNPNNEAAQKQAKMELLTMNSRLRVKGCQQIAFLNRQLLQPLFNDISLKISITQYPINPIVTCLRRHQAMIELC